MHPIIEEIFEGVAFSAEESSLLFSKLRRIDLRKGDHLLKAGQVIDDMFYVHSGCLRSYCVDHSGKEHILQLSVKGWWTSDYIALFGAKRTKSVSYIECIQDATLYGIAKKDLDEFYRNYPKVANFRIRKMELAFAAFQKRILENLTLTAKERYINFVDAYPEITGSVKNYHIASFLGITTESLSRIRKEIAQG